jgi:hypothetical protein
MKPSLRQWGTFLLLLSIFFFNHYFCLGAICTAKANGNWESTTTWACNRLPQNGDTLIIPPTILVTVNLNNPKYSNMYLKINGTLSFINNSARIELDNDGIVEVDQNGKITTNLPKNNNASAKLRIGNRTIYDSNDPDKEAYQYCTQAGCNVGIPTPISLLHFEPIYQPAQGRVRLEWITASEINNDYFTIERSTDAERFEGIEQIRGAGNSKEQRAYTTYDESPLPGLSYYRLRQTDFDGASTVSKLMAVHNTGTQGQFGFEVAPNPFDGQNLNLLLRGETAGKVSVTVFGSLGQKYYDHLQPIESGRLSLRLNQPLAGGVYWVKVSQAGQTATQAVLVRH